MEFLTKIVVVAGGAHRDAGANGRVKITGMAVPLFQSVALEKQFVKSRTGVGQNDFLAIGWVRARDAFLFQPSLKFRFRGRLTISCS